MIFEVPQNIAGFISACSFSNRFWWHCHAPDEQPPQQDAQRGKQKDAAQTDDRERDQCRARERSDGTAHANQKRVQRGVMTDFFLARELHDRIHPTQVNARKRDAGENVCDGEQPHILRQKERERNKNRQDEIDLHCPQTAASIDRSPPHDVKQGPEDRTDHSEQPDLTIVQMQFVYEQERNERRGQQSADTVDHKRDAVRAITRVLEKNAPRLQPIVPRCRNFFFVRDLSERHTGQNAEECSKRK
jgi:hypothetical protein